jgi:GR25 family glycosyltransferase involved in LPS biosynthesis
MIKNTKSLLHNYYDRINCICLKERDDKYQFMKTQFEKHNIDVDFYRPVIHNYASKFIELYADKYNNYEINRVFFNKSFPNEFGALQSHYTVIKSALLDGVENLFVFEDDCIFHRDWETLLPKYLETIPENTDGILLYSFMDRLLPENTRIKPRWTKGYASWSFVAYGLNRRAMEGYIKLQDTQPMIADRGSWELMTFHKYNFIVASPPLVLPSKTLTSSIRGENKNYERTKTVFLMGVDENLYE